MDERMPTHTVLANNLRYLMKDRGWTQMDLAKRAGVGQRTVSNILSETKVPNLDTVEAIATAFGLNLWHLIMPTLIEDLQSSTSIRQVYARFFSADSKGKASILSVAEMAADYNKEAS